jgi:hypothetical protein
MVVPSYELVDRLMKLVSYVLKLGISLKPNFVRTRQYFCFYLS